MSGIDLDGTVVAMTGASVGLGRSMSLALAKAGARVVLAAPETDLLEAVAAEIDAKAGPGRALSAQDRHHRPRRLRAAVGREHPPVRRAACARQQCAPSRCAVRAFRRRAISCRSGNPIRTSGRSRCTSTSTARSRCRTWSTPHLIRNGWGRIVNINTSLGGLSQSRNSPYGVTKAALESATLIFAADLAGTGVTVNSLLPGGACDTDPNRPPDPNLKLLPVDIMNPAIVWLASKRSDGKTGGRYIGRLWNDKLPPDRSRRRCVHAAGAADDRGLMGGNR